MVISNEVEELRKRLEAAEKQDLFIVQEIGRLIFTMTMRTANIFLKSEDLKSYNELWGKKFDAARKELEGTQTVKTAFDVIYNFDKELSQYVRAEKVDTADKAMEIAHSFIKKYSPVTLPLKAVKEGDVWTVDIDVGALAVKIAKVKVDARTGDVLSYDIPQRESQRS